MEQQMPFIDINQMEFRIYSDKDIDKISVMQVTSEEAINKLGHCNRGGLYDIRMGPMMRISDERCGTCMQKSEACIGHCGHIDLALPVYNPVFVPYILKLLRVICLGCGKLQAFPEKVLQLQCQMRLLAAGFTPESLDVPQVIGNVTEHTMKLNYDGTESKLDARSPELIEKIAEALNHYYDSVISGETASKVECEQTSTVRSVREECTREFLHSIRLATRCRFCKFAIFKVEYKNSQMVINVKSEKLQRNIIEGNIVFSNETHFHLDLTQQSILTPLQARDLLQYTWTSDSIALTHMFPIFSTSTFEVPTDMFFLSKLLVIPPKYRPLGKVKDAVMEHESCVLLKNVLRLCRCMKFLAELIKESTTELSPEVRLILNEIPGSTDHQKADKVWQLLQGSVDNLLDATANMEVNQTQRGIKQIFEKKAGLFRSNLMGKRVNFSARSVLAPDPALAVDEVGVPLDFAKHLHYPVSVTPRNVAFLRKLVINGPENYPGAHMIKSEDGRVTHLRAFSVEQRTAFAKKLLTPPESTCRLVQPCKTVYRQLLHGDWVLMNRQPTLHRPSIQAHKVRVLPGVRVLSLPYANCKAFNADFDGDEMNLHFPQNELARSEALHLVATHHNYLTPKDGGPLAGLVQDCVVAGVLLSVRGQMFNREDYIQMVNVALQDHMAPVRTLLPAILKPRQLWSGKQIISTLLHNLIPHQHALPTFKFKTSVKVDVWNREPPRTPRGGEQWGSTSPDAMSESEFIMRDGELISGVLDKSAIGSTSYGLIHVCYDLYGGQVASRLLTAFNRLCMYFLQLHGHTISTKEFLTPSSVSEKRRSTLQELIEAAPANVLQQMDMDEEQFRQFWESNHLSFCDKNLALIDAAYTKVLGKSTSEVTMQNENGLFRHSLDNKMRLMVDSGAKGTKVNMNQMASLFGPTAIDGKRMPLSLAGKALPSFLPYDMNPRAGGYISSRFMTGMDPQSYFYLCIVGRDSLQHTAVKTANSGYMQRCLIKHLEGIQVMYDMTVRNSDGLVLQFSYGEDGLDVMKVPFLMSPSTLDVVVDNYTRLLDPAVVVKTAERAQQARVHKEKKKVTKWLKKYSHQTKETRCTGFLLFCKDQEQKEAQGGRAAYDKRRGRSLRALELQKKWEHLHPEERKAYIGRAYEEHPPQPAPILSKYSGHDKLGAVSEVIDDLIDSYYNNHYTARGAHHRTQSKQQIERTVLMKALKAHVDPGEAVGAICAQAIGEPLTQMTLNTFHFAGKDELNVTLGVPRMVEILRTASSRISTPIMEVPFLPGVTRGQAETLKKKFTEVTLNQVLHSMEAKVIEVHPDSKRRNTYYHRVVLRFTLYPTSHYRQELPVTSRDVLKFMEQNYFEKGILKRLNPSSAKVPDICTTLDRRSKVFTEDENRDNYDDEDAKGSKAAEVNDVPDDSEEEAESGNEDDGVTNKARQTKHNEQDYEDDEEEEEEEEDNPEEEENQGEHEDGSNKKKVTATQKQEGGSEDEGFAEEEMDIEARAGASLTSKKSSVLTPEQITKRIHFVKRIHSTVVDYDFDSEKEEWCEITLEIKNMQHKYDFKSIVSNSAAKAYVHRIAGIKRAFIEEKNGQLVLKTEGVNVYQLVEWANLLDIRRLYTNDIQLVARTLGIEAAQRSIIREIRAVQSAYNISVDYRHLTLLADYFTCDGVYKACSRSAIGSSQSPLQQMSYESTLGFLRSSLTGNVPDRMQSPSARIASGQVIRSGTNSMDVLVDMPAIFANK